MDYYERMLVNSIHYCLLKAPWLYSQRQRGEITMYRQNHTSKVASQFNCQPWSNGVEYWTS